MEADRGNWPWASARPLIAMVHLLPLPGSPRWGGSMNQVIDRALADAALLAAGFDGLLIENYNDTPFFAARVPAETVAAMTAVISAIRRELPHSPLGLNVLRNDARAALAVAAATGASFLRVNVHTGALLTDQGWIRGRAAHTLRMRARLHLDCAILADVAVKHARISPAHDVAAEAADTRFRGLADILLVSGPSTGQAPDPERIRRVRDAVPGTPVWIASGLSPRNLHALLPLADGAIVGSSLQCKGVAGNAVDAQRVREFLEAARQH